MTEQTATRPTITVHVSTSHDESTDWSGVGRTRAEMDRLWMAMVEAAVDAEYGEAYDVEVVGEPGQMEPVYVVVGDVDYQTMRSIEVAIEALYGMIVTPLEMTLEEIDAAFERYC